MSPLKKIEAIAPGSVEFKPRGTTGPKNKHKEDPLTDKVESILNSGQEAKLTFDGNSRNGDAYDASNSLRGKLNKRGVPIHTHLDWEDEEAVLIIGRKSE